MLNQDLANYLDLVPGDSMEVILNFPGLSKAQSTQPQIVARMFALMTSTMPDSDRPLFDFKQKLVSMSNTTDQRETFSFNEIFGADEDSDMISLNSTLSGTFTKSYGKFPEVYGNVVILDCHYVFDNILDAWQEKVQSGTLKFTDPRKYAAIIAAIGYTRNFMKSNE